MDENYELSPEQFRQVLLDHAVTPGLTDVYRSLPAGALWQGASYANATFFVLRPTTDSPVWPKDYELALNDQVAPEGLSSGHVCTTLTAAYAVASVTGNYRDAFTGEPDFDEPKIGDVFVLPCGYARVLGAHPRGERSEPTWYLLPGDPGPLWPEPDPDRARQLARLMWADDSFIAV